MRILMVAPTSFFAHYGGHIRILEEARGLQELGHKVGIVTYNKGNDVPGLQIWRTARLPWHADYEVGSSRHKLAFDVYLIARALRAGLRFRPDVVHGHMHEGSLIGGLVARLLRVPLVFDFQGSLTGEMIDHGFIRATGPGYRLWRQVEQLASTLPDAILVSSVRAVSLLNREFQVPLDKIVALPDCADLEHFDIRRFSDEERAVVRQRFGIPPGRKVVVYLGLLADYQGTPLLLYTAERLHEMGEDVHFLIMGFPNEDQYAEMAAGLGLQDRVTLTGRVDYLEEAPLYLSLGDVAVSAKLSATEGSGKVLNYMAAAQPVVAFDTPVHREYLGDAGLYAPPGDIEVLAQQIADLLRDPSRGQELGAQLRRRAATQYSWPAAVRQIEQVYRTVLGQPEASPEVQNRRLDLPRSR